MKITDIQFYEREDYRPPATNETSSPICHMTSPDWNVVLCPDPHGVVQGTRGKQFHFVVHVHS